MEQTNTLPLETEKLYRKYIKQLGARFHKHYLNSINEVFGAWLTQHKKEWTLRNKKTPSLNDLLSYKPEKIKDFFKRFINVINKEKELESKKAITANNKLDQYKSDIKLFCEFLISQSNKEAQTIELPVTDDIFYSREELTKNFTNRLLIQDRISSKQELLFPIRLINKLESEETKKWAQENVNNIVILILKEEKIEEIKLEDIEYLIIKKNETRNSYKYEFVDDDDCNTYVQIKEDKQYIEYPVCTYYCNIKDRLRFDGKNLSLIYFDRTGAKTYKKKTDCIPNEIENGFQIDNHLNIYEKDGNRILWRHIKLMNVNDIRGIAIDHDIPMSDILKNYYINLRDAKNDNNLYKLTMLYKKISEIFNISLTASNINTVMGIINYLLKNKARGNIKKLVDNKKNEEIDKCTKELGKIEITKKLLNELPIKLVLMEAHENSIKSNK